MDIIPRVRLFSPRGKTLSRSTVDTEQSREYSKDVEVDPDSPRWMRMIADMDASSHGGQWGHIFSRPAVRYIGQPNHNGFLTQSNLNGKALSSRKASINDPYKEELEPYFTNSGTYTESLQSEKDRINQRRRNTFFLVLLLIGLIAIIAGITAAILWSIIGSGDETLSDRLTGEGGNQPYGTSSSTTGQTVLQSSSSINQLSTTSGDATSGASLTESGTLELEYSSTVVSTKAPASTVTSTQPQETPLGSSVSVSSTSSAIVSADSQHHFTEMSAMAAGHSSVADFPHLFNLSRKKSDNANDSVVMNIVTQTQSMSVTTSSERDGLVLATDSSFLFDTNTLVTLSESHTSFNPAMSPYDAVSDTSAISPLAGDRTGIVLDSSFTASTARWSNLGTLSETFDVTQLSGDVGDEPSSLLNTPSLSSVSFLAHKRDSVTIFSTARLPMGMSSTYEHGATYMTLSAVKTSSSAEERSVDGSSFGNSWLSTSSSRIVESVSETVVISIAEDSLSSSHVMTTEDIASGALYVPSSGRYNGGSSLDTSLFWNTASVLPSHTVRSETSTSVDRSTDTLTSSDIEWTGISSLEPSHTLQTENWLSNKSSVDTEAEIEVSVNGRLLDGSDSLLFSTLITRDIASRLHGSLILQSDSSVLHHNVSLSSSNLFRETKVIDVSSVGYNGVKIGASLESSVLLSTESVSPSLKLGSATSLGVSTPGYSDRVGASTAGGSSENWSSPHSHVTGGVGSKSVEAFTSVYDAEGRISDNIYSLIGNANSLSLSQTLRMENEVGSTVIASTPGSDGGISGTYFGSSSLHIMDSLFPSQTLGMVGDASAIFHASPFVETVVDDSPLGNTKSLFSSHSSELNVVGRGRIGLYSSGVDTELGDSSSYGSSHGNTISLLSSQVLGMISDSSGTFSASSLRSRYVDSISLGNTDSLLPSQTLSKENYAGITTTTSSWGSDGEIGGTAFHSSSVKNIGILFPSQTLGMISDASATFDSTFLSLVVVDDSSFGNTNSLFTSSSSELNDIPKESIGLYTLGVDTGLGRASIDYRSLGNSVNLLPSQTLSKGSTASFALTASSSRGDVGIGGTAVRSSSVDNIGSLLPSQTLGMISDASATFDASSSEGVVVDDASLGNTNTLFTFPSLELSDNAKESTEVYTLGVDKGLGGTSIDGSSLGNSVSLLPSQTLGIISDASATFGASSLGNTSSLFAFPSLELSDIARESIGMYTLDVDRGLGGDSTDSSSHGNSVSLSSSPVLEFAGISSHNLNVSSTKSNAGVGTSSPYTIRATESLESVVGSIIVLGVAKIESNILGISDTSVNSLLSSLATTDFPTSIFSTASDSISAHLFSDSVVSTITSIGGTMEGDKAHSTVRGGSWRTTELPKHSLTTGNSTHDFVALTTVETSVLLSDLTAHSSTILSTFSNLEGSPVTGKVTPNSLANDLSIIPTLVTLPLTDNHSHTISDTKSTTQPSVAITSPIPPPYLSDTLTTIEPSVSIKSSPSFSSYEITNSDHSSAGNTASVTDLVSDIRMSFFSSSVNSISYVHDVTSSYTSMLQGVGTSSFVNSMIGSSNIGGTSSSNSLEKASVSNSKSSMSIIAASSSLHISKVVVSSGGQGSGFIQDSMSPYTNSPVVLSNLVSASSMTYDSVVPSMTETPSNVQQQTVLTTDGSAIAVDSAYQTDYLSNSVVPYTNQLYSITPSSQSMSVSMVGDSIGASASLGVSGQSSVAAWSLASSHMSGSGLSTVLLSEKSSSSVGQFVSAAATGSTEMLTSSITGYDVTVDSSLFSMTPSSGLVLSSTTATVIDASLTVTSAMTTSATSAATFSSSTSTSSSTSSTATVTSTRTTTTTTASATPTTTSTAVFTTALPTTSTTSSTTLANITTPSTSAPTPTLSTTGSSPITTTTTTTTRASTTTTSKPTTLTTTPTTTTTPVITSPTPTPSTATTTTTTAITTITTTPAPITTTTTITPITTTTAAPTTTTTTITPTTTTTAAPTTTTTTTTSTTTTPTTTTSSTTTTTTPSTTVTTTTIRPPSVQMRASPALLYSVTPISCTLGGDNWLLVGFFQLFGGSFRPIAGFAPDGTNNIFLGGELTASRQNSPNGTVFTITFTNISCEHDTTYLCAASFPDGTSINDYARQQVTLAPIPPVVTYPSDIREGVTVTLTCEATVIVTDGDINWATKRLGETSFFLETFPENTKTQTVDTCKKTVTNTLTTAFNMTTNGTEIRCESVNPNAASTSQTLLILPSDFCSPHPPNALVTHPYDCNTYIICIPGLPNLLTQSCPGSLCFDQEQQRCVEKSDQEESIDSDPYSCTGKANGAYIPIQNSCNKYSWCVNGQAIEQTCAAGTHFTEISGPCTFDKTSAYCDESLLG